ncbi:hypothetical protein L226DRAFT_129438 [Lentinus tigrinus ALCF2SS1-7]|uniref:PUB domain-containing protein n=1 Tax=Lentinus tigrinus ALCF2SS1-6 TaxID=1328759 RepID=A0A5C2SVQ4_9APHY|nr:hypothetical protein L227DRAFT_596958 [Lentinus tigrinus ALCF2SS1-6]RPD81099.1 hypothetical protein L226DRAFT_129438 [Lentinus tigrinus ALCF2SS1-7]
MSTTGSNKNKSVDRATIGLAAQLRAMSLRNKQILYMPFDEEWSLRQDFRRRIDREIIQGNKPKVAIGSLKMVLRLARNILANPEEDKYRRFKITNCHIKSTIMEPKGVLELMMDLGFRIKAENFESICVYSSKTYNELRVGSSIIEEILEREVKKQEDEERRQERVKAEAEAHKQKLQAQFLDDRQSVHARCQRERHLPPLKGIPARKGGPRKAEIATIHGGS